MKIPPHGAKYNIRLYFVFSLVHFIELSINSQQKCKFVLYVMLQNKKKLEKINTLAKNSV